MKNLKRTAIDMIAREHDVEARKLKLKELYEKALKEINCEKLKNKVFTELEEIPVVYVNKDSFFVTAHDENLNDFQIINSILSPYEATFEHIIPASQNGPDDVSNGIVMCRACNTARGDEHYINFIKYHPRMPYNTQKQILQISQLVLTGKVDENMGLYPINVAKTLSDYTAGVFSPDITSYCKKGSKKVYKKIDKEFKEMKVIKEERDQMLAEKAELEKKLQELENSIQEKRTKLKQVNNNITRDLKIKSTLENHINLKT